MPGGARKAPPVFAPGGAAHTAPPVFSPGGGGTHRGAPPPNLSSVDDDDVLGDLGASDVGEIESEMAAFMDLMAASKKI